MVRRTDIEGKAILDKEGNFIENISCEATAGKGCCPYKNAVNKTGMTEGAVYGMFGTPCWYRGKWGNYLLEALEGDAEYSFYGDNDDQTEKSPESCRATADYMEELLDEQLGDNKEFIVNGEDLVPQVRYAVWWLRWVADEADGSNCWY